MALQSWSTRIRHDSDAVFREWGLEFSTKLGLVGLVQTADTGQINWTTVVRAGANADAGYEIWRMNDTEQTPYPIFFKITYGTANGVSAPRIRFQVGRGSDGAGALTGTFVSSTELMHSNAATAQTADTTRQSYMSCVRGWFGVVWKVGAINGCFLFNRECDTSGVSSGPGYFVHWGSSNQASWTRRLSVNWNDATSIASTTGVDGQICLNPLSRAVSTVGADIQGYTAFAPFPRVKGMFGVMGVISTELAIGGTFTYTPVGVTPRTYITLPGECGPAGSLTALGSGGLCMAMIWE
jgi:hypothetical protein